jgi:hypothetical protein
MKLFINNYMNFNGLVQILLEQNSLGLIEDIEIPGIGKIKAKTDTGNEAHNVLHGTNIKIEGERVLFTCENGKRVTMPLKEIIKIHIGGGNMDDRPVVVCDCLINNKKYFRVPFSVTDRSENNYKALLGAPFIKANGGVVDVTKRD